jgi:hypothetical protein
MLSPRAGYVVAHGHEEHYGEPKNGGDNDQLSTLGAVLGVHKEENYERSFEHSDGQRDDDVQAWEVRVKVDSGGEDGQDGANHESAEYSEVDLG